MNELEPCPFCGAKVELTDYCESAVTMWIVFCPKCFVFASTGEYMSDTKTPGIVDKWNHRHENK